MIRDLLQNFFQVPNKYQIQSYNHCFLIIKSNIWAKFESGLSDDEWIALIQHEL